MPLEPLAGVIKGENRRGNPSSVPRASRVAGRSECFCLGDIIPGCVFWSEVRRSSRAAAILGIDCPARKAIVQN
jgi:hypothetical protein